MRRNEGMGEENGEGEERKGKEKEMRVRGEDKTAKRSRVCSE